MPKRNSGYDISVVLRNISGVFYDAYEIYGMNMLVWVTG
jgi:hypothetical protein